MYRLLLGRNKMGTICILTPSGRRRWFVGQHFPRHLDLWCLLLSLLGLGVSLLLLEQWRWQWPREHNMFLQMYCHVLKVCALLVWLVGWLGKNVMAPNDKWVEGGPDDAKKCWLNWPTSQDEKQPHRSLFRKSFTYTYIHEAHNKRRTIIYTLPPEHSKGRWTRHEKDQKSRSRSR